MALKHKSTDMKVISGYFLAPDNDGQKNGYISDESEFDSDDNYFEDLDFSDDNVFSGETFRIESKFIKSLKVRIKEYNTNKVYEVVGPFPLTDVWWSVIATVRGRFLVGFPSYSLRTDNAVADDGVVWLFLKACQVEEQHITHFNDYLRQTQSHTGLTFENLCRNLNDYTSCINEDIGSNIRQRISSGEGRHVWKSYQFPLLYKMFAQLLPRHICRIVDLDEVMLAKLEKAVAEKPWVFGFSSVLSRDFKIYGCEASFKQYSGCRLIYSQLTDVQKDGLYIYDTLKYICSRGGHTFVTFRHLRNWYGNRISAKYNVKDWSLSLDFLEHEGIIVREKFGNDILIYLKRFWNAEMGIANHFRTLMRHDGVPDWNLKIDLESKHFERIRTDEDQLLAMRLIAEKPVVVLSGKGGCGKTEVVAQVFSYMQQNLDQECMFNECSISDEELIQYMQEAENMNCGSDHVKPDDHGDFKTSPDLLNFCSALTYLKPSTIEDSKIPLPYGHYTITDFKPDAFDILKTSPEFKDLKLVDLENFKTSTASSETVTNLSSAQKSEVAACFSSSTAPASTLRCCEILLTAPTGKAANLLGRRSCMNGYTLHQVAYSYKTWQDSLVKKLDWKFASVRILVVDECSLVPVTIFQRVLWMLITHAKLSKVVLLGDVNQLPSIGPGRFLADVFEAMTDFGCSVMLRTNHRSESVFIVENAERIFKQQLPIIDPKRNFFQENLPEDDPSLENSRDVAITDLLNKHFLKDHEKSQFIAFRRSDCEAVNEICCKYYNKHSIMKFNKKGKQVRDFRPGDKVCCTRNAFIVDYTDMEQGHDSSQGEKVSCSHNVSDSSDQKEAQKPNKAGLIEKTVRLCNGEIFFIDNIIESTDNKGTKKCSAELSDLDRVIKVDFNELRAKCKLRHAWARTIHTFQGSETDILVYVVGSSGRFQTWQHVYTAVTRGRQQVHLVTRPSFLRSSIARKPEPRKTSLKRRLQEIIAKSKPMLLKQEKNDSESMDHSQQQTHEIHEMVSGTSKDMVSNSTDELRVSDLCSLNESLVGKVTSYSKTNGCAATFQKCQEHKEGQHSLNFGQEVILKTSVLSHRSEPMINYMTPVKESIENEDACLSSGKRKMESACWEENNSATKQSKKNLADSLMTPIRRQLNLDD